MLQYYLISKSYTRRHTLKKKKERKKIKKERRKKEKKKKKNSLIQGENWRCFRPSSQERAKKSHYKSMVFVWVLSNSADAVDWLLIITFIYQSVVNPRVGGHMRVRVCPPTLQSHITELKWVTVQYRVKTGGVVRV